VEMQELSPSQQLVWRVSFTASLRCWFSLLFFLSVLLFVSWSHCLYLMSSLANAVVSSCNASPSCEYVSSFRLISLVTLCLFAFSFWFCV
jgi:hypothetical protein